MSEQISCYDAYELFLSTLNSKPVTEREKALCRAFFQSAWEAKEVELSASQAREAELIKQRDEYLVITAACRDACGDWQDFPEAMGDPAEVPAVVKRLRERADAAERENAELRKLLEESKVPEGWQLVPKEPSQAMIDAGDPAFDHGYVADAYKAMLAAAPTQPKEPKQ